MTLNLSIARIKYKPLHRGVDAMLMEGWVRQTVMHYAERFREEAMTWDSLPDAEKSYTVRYEPEPYGERNKMRASAVVTDVNNTGSYDESFKTALKHIDAVGL